LRPPRKIVRKAGESTSESKASITCQRTGCIKAWPISPTAIVLETTTMPISDRMPTLQE
jgi:hypothetical protein